jgi:hypothetical protein
MMIFFASDYLFNLMGRSCLVQSRSSSKIKDAIMERHNAVMKMTFYTIQKSSTRSVMSN